MNHEADSDSSNYSTSNLRPWSQAWFESQRRNLGDTACANMGIYSIPDSFVLSVVIPVYNEEASLEQLLRRVVDVPINKQIIMIDDGSSDRSVQIARDLISRLATEENKIQLLVHEVNKGKGAAIISGFKAATGDIVLIQDADLEYDPCEYPALLKPIIDGKAEVVYGSRFLGGHSRRVLYYWHYLGNKLLTTVSNLFTNLNLTDMETCYKVFAKEVIDEIAPKLQQQRFGIEPEITSRIARRNYRVFELPISYSGRTYSEGKKIGWRDGLKAFWCIFRYGIAE